MSSKDSTNGRQTKAVLYLCRSTDRQEASIADQRASLQEHAKRHSYKIVGKYVDDSISGDRTEDRAAYLRMRDLASSR